MSLYRESGGGGWRRTALIGGVALVVGLGGGFGLGRATAPDPTGGDLKARLADELRPVSSGLELVPTEYGDVQAGEGGESVAVTQDLAAIRSGLAAARGDLQALDPAGLEALTRAVDALDQAVKNKASGADVKAKSAAAQQQLAALPGGS
jgi:hypothetical protein